MEWIGSIGFAVNWISCVREKNFGLRDIVMTLADIRNTENRASVRGKINNSVQGIVCGACSTSKYRC